MCAPDLAEPGRHLCLSEEATRRECERSTDSGWRARFCQQLELSEPCRAVYQDALSRTDCARRREFLTRPTPDEPAPYEEKTPGCPRLPARAVRRARQRDLERGCVLHAPRQEPGMRHEPEAARLHQRQRGRCVHAAEEECVREPPGA